MLLVAATIIVALEIALRATIVAVKLTAFTAIVAIATAFVAALRLAALVAATIIVAIEFALAVTLLVAALALRATEAAFVAVAASARVAALAVVSAVAAAVAAAVVVRSVAARFACALVIVCHLQCLPLNLARLDVLHARSERTSIHFLFPVRLYFQNLENAVGASEEQPFLREQHLALRKARCGLEA